MSFTLHLSSRRDKGPRCGLLFRFLRHSRFTKTLNILRECWLRSLLSLHNSISCRQSRRLCCYLFCLLRYNNAAHEWHDPPAGQDRTQIQHQWNALSSCLSRYIFVLLLRLSGLCILGRICLLRLLLRSFPVCLGPLFIQKRLKIHLLLRPASRHPDIRQGALGDLSGQISHLKRQITCIHLSHLLSMLKVRAGRLPPHEYWPPVRRSAVLPASGVLSHSSPAFFPAVFPVTRCPAWPRSSSSSV